MEVYDPNKAIDPEQWLELDEQTRIDLVTEFHEEQGLYDEMNDQEEGSSTLHSTIHAIVENQLAMEVEFVPKTMAKLLRQGLDRHEAIHAIGAIITEDIFAILQGENEHFFPTNNRRKLEKLTAKRWLKGQY